MAETQETVVLVGSSLTEASDPVVRGALAVTRALAGGGGAPPGATLHLAHGLSYPVELFDSTMLSDQVLDELREKEQRAVVDELREQARRLGATEEEIHGLSALPGEPHRVLIDLVEELDPALVVVGAAEAEGRITRAFGSTAGRVIRKASRPVLVVRGELPVPPERVLLPVDLSPLSLDAVRAGLAFLDRVRGDRTPEVEALFVLTEREERILRARARQEGRDEEPAELARRDLERFLEAATGDPALRPTPRLVAGQAADEIVARAEELGADLTIVGTHGRSGFERLMIGSVAADVVRAVPGSVLVIPPSYSTD